MNQQFYNTGTGCRIFDLLNYVMSFTWVLFFLLLLTIIFKYFSSTIMNKITQVNIIIYTYIKSLTLYWKSKRPYKKKDKRNDNRQKRYVYPTMKQMNEKCLSWKMYRERDSLNHKNQTIEPISRKNPTIKNSDGNLLIENVI